MRCFPRSGSEKRGSTGVMRQDGVVLMRLDAWVLDGSELSAFIDNVPLLADENRPVRVTLFDGEPCVIDGMYYIDAAIFIGDKKTRIVASILTSDPVNLKDEE